MAGTGVKLALVGIVSILVLIIIVFLVLIIVFYNRRLNCEREAVNVDMACPKLLCGGMEYFPPVNDELAEGE